MEEMTITANVKILATRAREAQASFAEEVKRGLTARPKFIPPHLLYDAKGSRLFEEICAQPEYYLTRTEASILRDRAAELARTIEPSHPIVELGSGSGEKTRILLDALLEANGSARYVPIDISKSAVEESVKGLAETFDGLEIEGIVAEYRDALREIGRRDESGKLLLWLGSSIGNMERRHSVELLRQLRAAMGDEGRVLVGIDARKPREVVEPAYDDAAGVSAAFAMNVLDRMNRELDAEFDLDHFSYGADWVPEESRIEMYLLSQRDQRVRIGALGFEVPFAADERIRTEYSHKYSPEEVDHLAAEAGLEVEQQWYDARRYFGLHLLAAA